MKADKIFFIKQGSVIISKLIDLKDANSDEQLSLKINKSEKKRIDLIRLNMNSYFGEDEIIHGFE